MLTSILIDDEQHAIDLLEIHLKKIEDIVIVGSFNNPLKALDFLKTNAVDLIFLDIEMPEISGISFMSILGRRSNIIITSAYRQYAFEGFENDVIDYLLKPVSFERLLQSLQKSKTKNHFKEPAKPYASEDFIILKTDSKNKLLKVALSEIVYIEGLKNYISVFTVTQRIVVLLNMKSLDENLPKDRFIRIHKSYIVALDKFRAVDGNRVFLEGIDRGLPIGDGYKTSFLNIIKRKLIENK